MSGAQRYRLVADLQTLDSVPNGMISLNGEAVLGPLQDFIETYWNAVVGVVRVSGPSEPDASDIEWRGWTLLLHNAAFIDELGPLGPIAAELERSPLPE